MHDRLAPNRASSRTPASSAGARAARSRFARGRHARLLALLLASFAWLGAPGARAEAPNEATAEASLAEARADFQRGVQASSRGDFREAVEHFERSLAAHPAPTTAYNLAAALFELRSFVASYNHVQRVLADPTTPDALRAKATELASTLELEVARLQVVLGGDAETLRATVDGRALEAHMLDRPFAVEEGTHEVAALRGEEVLSRRSLDIPLRTIALVDLSIILAETPPSPSPLTREPAHPPRRDGWYERNRKVLWVSAAVALAAGSALTVALLMRDREGAPAALQGDAGALTW